MQATVIAATQNPMDVSWRTSREVFYSEGGEE